MWHVYRKTEMRQGSGAEIRSKEILGVLSLTGEDNIKINPKCRRVEEREMD